MKKHLIIFVVFTLVLSLGLISNTTFAGKGGNGNGYPEGDHFNLNLIAKKSDPAGSSYFNCPSPDDYQWNYYKDNVGICTDLLIDTDACQKCDPDIETCTVQVHPRRM